MITQQNKETYIKIKLIMENEQFVISKIHDNLDSSILMESLEKLGYWRERK